MFTGIVQTRLPVYRIIEQKGLRTFVLTFPESMLGGLKTGASVALNGTCLTVRQLTGTEVHFDAIAQTLKLTNLGSVRVGDEVNIERAARLGDEIGGHQISGHIMGQVEILQRSETDNNLVLWFERPQDWCCYLLDKGYVALNGCSLTIAEIEADRFSVHLIPETREITTFGALQVGDRVNLEVDPQTQAVVDTVRQLLAQPEMMANLARSLRTGDPVQGLTGPSENG